MLNILFFPGISCIEIDLVIVRSASKGGRDACKMAEGNLILIPIVWSTLAQNVTLLLPFRGPTRGRFMKTEHTVQ